MNHAPPIDFHGIDHVVLKVTDIERSLHFYCELLGLNLERIIEDAGIYQLRCGRSIVDLELLPPGQSLADKAARDIGHVCLLMRGPFKPVLDYLQAQGVPIVFGPTELYGATGFGTSIYILDPDSHTIELKADHAVRPIRVAATAGRAARTPSD